MMGPLPKNEEEERAEKALKQKAWTIINFG